MKKSQKEKILNYLKKGKGITPLGALNKFGSFRLGARIKDLRDEGYKIETEPYKTRNGSIVAKYKMRGTNQ